MNHTAVPIAQEFFTGNGRIYACGTYYPRYHKMHWRCALSQAIWKCKHGNAASIRACGSLIASALDRALPREMAFVITFVPSEPEQRPPPAHHSCSAAQSLASVVFEELRNHRDISIERLISPVGHKPKKQHLCTTHQERRENVIGCFEVTRTDLVEAAHVIVVDDIATSGTTIGECYRVLLEAGAADVMGFVVARTVGWIENGRSL